MDLAPEHQSSAFFFLFAASGVVFQVLTLAQPTPMVSLALLALLALYNLFLYRALTALVEEAPAPLSSRYFVGVPAPAAAALALLPLTMSFVLGDTVLRSDFLNALTLLAVASITLLAMFRTPLPWAPEPLLLPALSANVASSMSVNTPDRSMTFRGPSEANVPVVPVRFCGGLPVGLRRRIVDRCCNVARRHAPSSMGTVARDRRDPP